MTTQEEQERPGLRMPYTRVERAGAILVWVFGAIPVGFPIFFASRFFPAATGVFNALAAAYLVGVGLMIAEYFIFEEKLVIDKTTVKYRRKSIFGTTEWSDRLPNYLGISVVTAADRKNPADAETLPRSHWSRRRPAQAIRLVSRDPKHSVTLWELDDRDFREAIGRKVQQFGELFDVPVLPGRNA